MHVEDIQFGRGSTTTAWKVCKHHQPTSAECPKLVAAQELKAARELEDDQYPSHAPQCRNQLETGVQINEEEVEGELLAYSREADQGNK